jgi:hypothetical protein
LKILLEIRQPNPNRERYDARIRLLRIDSGSAPALNSDSISNVNFSDLTYFLRYNAVFHRANLELQTPSTWWSRRAAGLDFGIDRGISNGGALIGDSYGFCAGLRGEFGPLRANLVHESRNDALRHPTRVGSDLIFPDTIMSTSDFSLQVGANLIPGTRWDLVPFGSIGLGFSSFHADRPKGDGTNDRITTFERSLPMQLRTGTGLEFSRNVWFGRILQFSSHLGWKMDWTLGSAKFHDVTAPRQAIFAGIGATLGHP